MMAKKDGFPINDVGNDSEENVLELLCVIPAVCGRNLSHLIMKKDTAMYGPV